MYVLHKSVSTQERGHTQLSLCCAEGQNDILLQFHISHMTCLSAGVYPVVLALTVIVIVITCY